MASPTDSVQTISAIYSQDISPQFDQLLRCVAAELETEELESVVKSIKNTFKGKFEEQQDQDLYSCLFLFANQGLLSGENLTLLEGFVASKASKKEGIKQKIENFKASRQQEVKSREELKGRRSDLEDVMARLKGTKPIVNLYGSGGEGKTTLAKEICLRWPGKHRISVDLRDLTEMKDVYFHIMLALDTERNVIKYDENPVIEQLQKLREDGQGDVLLLLDNADQFSGGDDDDNDAKMNANFMAFLHRLLNSRNNKGKAKLKVLLISRRSFRSAEERKGCMIDYKELEILEKGISTEILQIASGNPTIASNQMEKLVEMCKRKPLLLNGMAAILRQKVADAEELLKTIEQELVVGKLEDHSIPTAEESKKETEVWDYRSEGIDEGQLSCLKKMFFLLPSDTLKYSAVALSLFSRPFSVEAASFVLDTDTAEAVILLEGLRNSKVLSVDPEAKELVYDIHSLMRSFLRSVGSSPVFKNIYMKAKRRFCDFYMKKMNDIAALLDKDYMYVFEQFDLDKLNFEVAPDISSNSDNLHIPLEYEGIIMICHMFEAMLDANQRRKIFKSWADVAVEDGKEGSLIRAEMRCQEALTVLDVHGWRNAMKVLKSAEGSLNKLHVEYKSSDFYRRTRSSFLFVEGEINYRRENIPSALKSLFHSLEIMEEILKNHTSTTRCLNAIGNCYNALGNFEEALKFYTRAYEMRKEISGSKNHFDLPLFKGQIGTVYEGQKQYAKAIKCYEEALELSKELKRSGILRLALFHRNTANAYAWQKEFDKAYKSAMAGYEIRKDILGNHRHTARSAFQLGEMCKALEEFDEAEEFLGEAWEIEKSLENANHSAVRDRIVESYEEILRGDRKKEFQKEALEFYQRFWEEEKDFSYANKPVIDEINRRLSNSGAERKMVKKYENEALRFYEMAWNLPDLSQLPENQREDILQNILYLSESLRKKELHTRYQSEALEFYEKKLLEKTTMPTQDKKDILYTLQNLAKALGNQAKEEKYNKLQKELQMGSRKITKASETSTMTAFSKGRSLTINKEANVASNIISSDGGVVTGEVVELVFPPGAVDNSVTVKVTLEDPSKYYGLIAEKDLENDVMFCQPIINLQPTGHSFKKPVTLTTKFNIKHFKSDEILILHGTEARDGKITWQDITHLSKFNETKAEVNIEIERFSVIASLWRLTLIRTKDIVSRLNLLAFNYSMSVLLDENHDKLALLFVSQDVYHEQFYKEHETSALVQLKAGGFRELLVRPANGENEQRIYNHEKLQVSVRLGEDYKLAESLQRNGLLITVEAQVWWNTGHVVKLSLERTREVRTLCGKIGVEGQYGHTSERNFCELDLHGYVRKLLNVEGEIFNLLPIAQMLKMPEKSVDEVLKSWKDEDKQLEIILQHWLKDRVVVEDLVAFRKDLEGLKQDYKVTLRGQMHVRHLRDLATKILGLQHENADLTKHFSSKIQSLCKSVLRDCCIELASIKEVDSAASSPNHVDYLEMHRPTPKEVVQNYQRICSSSAECIITETFLTIVPYLIQTIKEIFVLEKIAQVQNGLKGLSDQTLEQYVSNVRDAGRNNRVRHLVCEVCKILEQLCLENCGKQPTVEIEKWGKSLALLSMLEFLKPFFQHCPQNVRLHKRLELFSGHLRDIMSGVVDVADEVCGRYFSNVSLSLIAFANFDPSKLVRFEVTDLTNSPLTCNIVENVKYDRHHDTFSQRFQIKKESEDELQLHASACVHIDGRVCKMGAFQSVITLSASDEGVFDKCVSRLRNVAMVKQNDEGSETLRVMLCSTQKEKLAEALRVLKNELSDDLVDFQNSEITPCHLTMRSVTAMEGDVLTLCLVYKWGSKTVILDSNDFVPFAASSADSACIPEVQLVGLTVPEEAEEACAALALTSPDGNSFALDTFLPRQLQKNTQIHCEKLEVNIHQTHNYMKGHLCVVGDKTTLNDQAPNQRALQEGPSSAPCKSITDGKR